MSEIVVESVQAQVPIASVVDTLIPNVPEVDIVAKVSQIKKPDPQNSAETYKEFDEIKDPVAKQVAIDRDKKRQADYTRKTQELAEQRRSLESKFKEVKTWTPQRIQQELLNNPEFLQAAQQIAGNQNPPNSGLTDEQFSALTDKEKQEFATLKSELSQMKQSNIQATIRSEIAQKDAHLQSKFGDYNPSQIDEATQKLATMNLANIREYVYKAQFHDEHVQAAYEMGKQDGRGLTQDKINAISPASTMNATNNDGIPTKEKGESDQAFFLRLGQFRLAQSKKR